VQKVNGAWIPVAQLTPAHLRWMQRNYTWKTIEHLPTGRLTLRAYAADRSVTWQQEWAEKKPGNSPTVSRQSGGPSSRPSGDRGTHGEGPR